MRGRRREPPPPPPQYTIKSGEWKGYDVTIVETKPSGIVRLALVGYPGVFLSAYTDNLEGPK